MPTFSVPPPTKTIKVTKAKAVKVAKAAKAIVPTQVNDSSTTIVAAASVEADEVMERLATNPIVTDSVTVSDATDWSDGSYTEAPWDIISSYFKGDHLGRLVRHQVESYNLFVNRQIQQTIDMFNPVHIVSEQDYDAESGKNSLEIDINFENFSIYRPQIQENNGATKIMFPQEARLRNFTYSSTMTVDVHIKYLVRNGPNLENSQVFHKKIPNIHIGKLPIMLKSSICVLNQYRHVSHLSTGECKFDAGGYFIINGSEKTVLGQERSAENRVYCFNVSKNSTKYTWQAEIKSIPDFKCISPKQINMMVSSKNGGFGFPITVQLPRIKQAVPLFALFRALGVQSDKHICDMILLDIDSENHSDMLKFLQASVRDAADLPDKESCLAYITSHVMYTPINMDREAGQRKKREFATDVITNDMFPHCNTKERKMYFLGYMTNKLIRASLGHNEGDDRDSYANKRIDLCGVLLNNLFRNYFNKVVKDMEKQVIREINTGSWKSTDDVQNIINQTNIYKIIKSTTIENGLKRALSTGDFGVKHLNSNKAGVAQVLNRLTYISSLSHARRISTPIDKSGKLVAPRKLHGTSWGFLCPAETPEGQSVGIVKNLSYLAHITVNTFSAPLHEYMSTLTDFINPIDNFKPIELYGKTKVFVNGCWIGVSDRSDELYVILKSNKYSGVINIYTSIVFNYKENEIRVCNDGGRITRPLLRVGVGAEKNKLLLTIEHIKKLRSNEFIWDDLLTNIRASDSAIEYVDPDEQQNLMVAMRPTDLNKRTAEDMFYRYTHCEIHPSTIFGILGSCIPFPEHNQSPRNTYQCLHPSETVWMADGSKKPIGTVVIGDEVLSFHPDTMEVTSTRVINQFVRPSEYPVYRLTTVSGHEIVATGDHKFMTDQGWKTVDDMRANHGIRIGIFSDKKRINPVSCSLIATVIQVDDCMVSDIEVESSNHSFIAGSGFASSNCAMGKQAMGVYVTNYQERMDKTAYVLNYPTRPLVDTRLMNIIDLMKIPSGTNVVVAIMSHTGYNQEDSLLFNQGSVDRGLFQATIYHTEKDEDKQKVNGDEEIRCKPDSTKTKGMKFANYNKVNGKGLVDENTLIENRDIIISKVTPIKENRNDPTKVIKYEDQSRVYRTNEDTYIDRNYLDRNGDGYTFAKVRLRAQRQPIYGDKFSSRHGQKGTIGNIIPEKDMPFTKSGIRPDIIINPHAIPSRMTIGQLKETLLGKVLVELGLLGDGTSFGDLDVPSICKELQNLGYESNGNDIMYNALTGEQIDASVFIGPVFYQRLKHMVADKQHSRSIGPMVNLTRQPAEGRSRDGGLRFGEMERDCMCSHGAARFTKERMYDVSDKYSVHVCKKCGMIASYNDKTHIHLCKNCDNRSDFSYVEIPYACKLLFQELTTMNVAPRLITK